MIKRAVRSRVRAWFREGPYPKCDVNLNVSGCFYELNYKTRILPLLQYSPSNFYGRISLVIPWTNTLVYARYPRRAGSKESIVRRLSIYFSKRLFLQLESVNSWSYNNNFVSYAKPPLFSKWLDYLFIIIKLIN